MYSEAAFNAFAAGLAAANGVSLEQAEAWAVRIGDAVELADDGRAVVRDPTGKELASVALPMEADGLTA